MEQTHLANQRCFGVDDYEQQGKAPFRKADDIRECGKTARKLHDMRYMTWFADVDENNDMHADTPFFKKRCMRQQQCICTDDGYNRLDSGVATVQIFAKWASDCALLADTPKCSAYFQFSPSPPPPSSVYGESTVTSMTGFIQQSGCSYNQKHAFYMKDYGAMPWLDCAKEASKRQLMMHAGYYQQQGVWGYAVLNPSRTHAQTGIWSSYRSAAIGSSLSCQLSRDKDSLSLYSISLSDSTWLQADVDIGGVAIRWRYKDFGTQFHDQCMELASQAGASMTTPDTLGITWPSGTSYWIPSSIMCNVMWFMSASQSGTAYSYDSQCCAGVRSSSTASCLAAFIA